MGCATKEDSANPTEYDREGERCFIVGKDGNTTDLTIGRYAGLVSFTLNDVGVSSVELGIYNSGFKNAEVFSAKGNSGSIVWHTKDGKAFIVGQLHSGENNLISFMGVHHQMPRNYRAIVDHYGPVSADAP